MKLKYTLYIVLGVCVIVGILVVVYQHRGEKIYEDLSRGRSMLNATSSASSSTSELRVGSNAIYVPDQVPSSMVTVGFVLLTRPGFVVIHEDAGEKPGAILGASSLVSAGETGNGVRIIFSRETKEGEELYAMLHQDDGDGTFSIANDLPVKDERGNVIMMSFAVDADATTPGEVSL